MEKHINKRKGLPKSYYIVVTIIFLLSFGYLIFSAFFVNKSTENNTPNASQEGIFLPDFNYSATIHHMPIEIHSTNGSTIDIYGLRDACNNRAGTLFAFSGRNDGLPDIICMTKDKIYEFGYNSFTWEEVKR